MKIFTGICLILIGFFFLGLTMDSLGKVGNFIMHFIAFFIAIGGAKIIIGRKPKLK